MSTLLERAANINWLRKVKERKNITRGSEVKPNEVKLQFSKYYYKKKNADIKDARTICIRIGFDIINLLGWKEKDKIYVDQNPDSLLETRLIKKENGGAGFSSTLRKMGHAYLLCLQWKYPDKIKLDFESPFAVQYHIFEKNQLLFEMKKVVMLGDIQHESV